jgi:hypothetical protein
MRRAIAAAGLLPTAALVAGCGKLEVIPSGAEKVVHEFELNKTGAHVKNVNCPSGISAKVGVTFDCHFNVPDGTKYTAHMRITKVKGTSVDFFVNSFPS